jgi:hypothetical protein
MQHQKHDDPAILDQAPWYHSHAVTQLRLFGLVALMIPLFSGLQYIVREGVPRVEVRLVTQDVPTTIAVEVPVERVVERVVYVPVERTSMVATTGAMEPARDIDLAPVKDESTTIADVPVHAPAAEPETVAEAPSPAAPVAEAPPATPEIIGVIAYAPPPPAPIVRAATVAARPAVFVAAPEVDEPEEVAADAEADAAVAEAEDDQADAGPVADVPEADQSARVAMVSPARQLGPGSNDSPLNGLGHELHQSEPKRQAAPAPDPEPAVEADVPDEAAAEGVTPEADVPDEAAEAEPADEMGKAETVHDESGAPAGSAEVAAEAVKESDEDASSDVAVEEAAPEDDGGPNVADTETPQDEGRARQANHDGPQLISIQQ